MRQIEWFKRNFHFDFDHNIFPSIIERLEGTPIRLESKLKKVPEDYLTIKLENKWSILEHLGHLNDLEPLWNGRLKDMLNQNEYLREADLTNRSTHESNHNEKSLKDLLQKFQKNRIVLVQELRNISPDQIIATALHPRLNQPMRLVDLFYFVAEHDDHHIASIDFLWRIQSS